jgi:putative transposase
LLSLDKGGDRLDKARSCAFQANYHHLIWATQYCRKVLVGSVEVRLLEVLKTVAVNHGYNLLAARVHDGDHVHVFVSAKLKVRISDVVCVLKSNSARLLFLEFVPIKLHLWGGHLWSEGYAARAAGVVTSAKIEEYINRS